MIIAFDTARRKTGYAYKRGGELPPMPESEGVVVMEDGSAKVAVQNPDVEPLVKIN